MQNIAIIGATSLIAQHCARIFIQGNDINVFLVGREAVKLKSIADDLRCRNPQSLVHCLETDFLDPLVIQNTVDNIFKFGNVDIVLIAHGYLPNQEECQRSLEYTRNALEINALSPVLFAEVFAKYFEKQNHGTIAIIGSVAGDRGRKSNYVYGAAKGLISRYAQGLQHRFAGKPVKIVLIKPGPTDTPMTAHLKNNGIRLASVNLVAKDIVKAIESGTHTIYTPRIWKIIMLIIMHIPSLIFIKLDL